MMPNTPVWLLLFILLLVVASLRTRTRVGLAAGLALIAVGGVIALSGVPHLRDPLILMPLKSFDYEHPQQPGLVSISAGGALVVAGIVAVRGYVRRRRD